MAVSEALVKVLLQESARQIDAEVVHSIFLATGAKLGGMVLSDIGSMPL